MTGPFLPGELVNPRLHATMGGLELRGLCGAHGAELDQIATAEELSPTAVAILALLVVLPRPKGRPMGVGLQLSACALAAVLGRSVRMVHYALRDLEALGLVHRFTQIRQVRTITAARPQPIRSFTYRTKKGTQTTRKAHMTAVLYPSWAGSRLMERHGWTVARVRPWSTARATVRTGLLAYLWTTLTEWISALARRCASHETHCTPYESKTRRDVESSSYVGRPGATQEGSAFGRPPGAHDGRAPPPLGSARGAPGRAAGMAGGRFAAEVERCWRHVVDVEHHRPTPARRGMNLDRWQLGFGYEPLPTGIVERRWSPILTAARWRPEAWARGTAEDRAVLAAQFEPVRRELAARIARGEAFDAAP